MANIKRESYNFRSLAARSVDPEQDPRNGGICSGGHKDESGIKDKDTKTVTDQGTERPCFMDATLWTILVNSSLLKLQSVGDKFP